MNAESSNYIFRNIIISSIWKRCLCYCFDFFSVSFLNLKPKGEREIFSELLTKSHDEISAKMTKWKIPSRHLQSWLIGSKSAKNYTGSMYGS